MINVEVGNVDDKPIELMVPLSLDVIKQALIEEFEFENVDVDIELDTFKVGRGISSLISSSSPCVAIYNRKYRRKYYSLILEVKEQYGRIFAYMHMGGTSKNSMNINMSKYHYSINEYGVNVHRPGIVSEMLGNRSKKAMQDEELYYDIAFEIVSSALAKATVNPERYVNHTEKVNTSSQPTRNESHSHASQKNQSYSESHNINNPYVSTDSQPKGNTNVEQNISSESKETSNGVLTIMWFVWILLAATCIMFGGVQAILTDILGIILLYLAQKLMQKGHIIWAILPIFIGSSCLSVGIMMLSAEVGVIVELVCSIIFYFSCFK